MLRPKNLCKERLCKIIILSILFFLLTQTLSKEYYELKNTSQQSVMELSTKNEELHTKLTIYEKLERELDDVVMQAAERTRFHSFLFVIMFSIVLILRIY